VQIAQKLRQKPHDLGASCLAEIVPLGQWCDSFAKQRQLLRGPVSS